MSCEEAPVVETGGLGNGFVVDLVSIWSSTTPVRNVVDDVSGYCCYWKVIGCTGSLSRLAFYSLAEVNEELASSSIVVASVVAFLSSDGLN